MSKRRIFELAACLDERVRFFAESDSDERAARVIGGGAATAAAGAGAYVGGKKIRSAVINRAGVVDDYGNMTARKGMYRDAARGAMADAKGAVKGAAKAAPGAVKGKLRNTAGDAMGKGAGLLRKGAGVLAKGRKKLYGFASDERERNIGGKIAVGAGATAAGYGAYRYAKSPKGSKLIDGEGGVKSKMQQGVARVKAGAGQAQDALQRGRAAAGDAVYEAKRSMRKGYRTMKGSAGPMMRQGKRKILKGIARGKKLVGLESLEDAVHELSAVLDASCRR